MRLIITEKNNSAKKIAEHLSTGNPKSDKTYSIPFYTWEDASGENIAVGLKGHVMNIAFPEQYSDWRKVDPRDLIDADLVKEPTQKNVVKSIKKHAKGADQVIIATDYDREGELIGLEALNEVLDVNGDLKDTVKRARYSALTKEEITEAFDNLTELSMPLAKAGEARQDIDLIWGASLTRFISLSTGRLGYSFLSVGRVQSPTLSIVVERELERRAHKPEPFWELLAEFKHTDVTFTAHHVVDKFWKEAEAKAAFEGTKSPGTVSKVEAKRQTRKPPAPFNTTAFTSAASSIGISPARAMRLAEDLYMDGFISYPRTDNTVYPDSLPVRELIQALAAVPAFSAAQTVAEKDKLEATRGKKQTTDHPPIYPTQAIDPGILGDEPKRKIYELVVRRFLATFSNPSVSESTRVEIEAGSETYFIRGTRVVELGFLDLYHYSRSKDEEIPKLEEGQTLEIVDQPWIEAKETKPPTRIGQGKLIEMMEERNLGTKATRHSIIQNLYDRGYVHGNPIQPTETGVAMAKALKEFAERIATPDMTAELEADMDQIANGDRSKDDVVKHSRELLHASFDALEEHKEKLAETIWEGMNQDKILGPCQVCAEAGRKAEDGSPNMLRIIRSKKTRKRFVGCQGYPDCDQSFPVPQRGELIPLEESCAVCGVTPRIKVVSGRRPWNLCLNPTCPSMEEMRAKQEERRKAKEAKAALEKEKAEIEGEVVDKVKVKARGGKKARIAGKTKESKPAKTKVGTKTSPGAESK